MIRCTRLTVLIVPLLIVIFLANGLLAEVTVPGFTVETYANLPGHPAMLSFDYTTGALYVGYDPGNGRIWRVEPGGMGVAPYGEADISDPDAVLFDALGLISGTPGAVLVGGSNHPSYTRGHIKAILPDESIVTIFDFTSDFINPGDMAFDSNGRLLFTDVLRGNVLATTSPTDPPAVLFSVDRITVGIAIDSQDRIYTSHGEDGTVLRHGPDGTVLDVPFASGLQTGIPGIMNWAPVVFGPGNVWGTELYSIDSNQNLVKIDSNGLITAIGSGFPLVGDLAFGPDGALYASIYEENRILRIVPEPAVTEVAIDIDPDVLNLKSRGRWITCYIWLPEPYDVADVDPDTIMLNGEIDPTWSWIDEAEQMLMAKFPRSEAQEILEPGEVELTVTGELLDGTKFEGSDTIRVIDKGTAQ